MNFNLKKPLVIFDLETTGLDVTNDRIIEIAAIKINIDGSEEIFEKRINPKYPISEEAKSVHGITEKDLENEPSFKDISKELLSFIGNADLAGFNSLKFDIPLLVEEFLRNDIDIKMKDRNLIDVQNIFHKMEPRNLKAGYKFYCGKDLINAHSALADTLATKEILKAQIEKYSDLEFEDSKGNISEGVKNDMNTLGEFSTYHKNADLRGQIIFDEKGNEIFNFGKNKGRLVEDVFRKEPQYFDWIEKSNFPLYTKKVFKEIYYRVKLKDSKSDFKIG
jgi:DNA polymerase-3 subunit epsilon